MDKLEEQCLELLVCVCSFSARDLIYWNPKVKKAIEKRNEKISDDPNEYRLFNLFIHHWMNNKSKLHVVGKRVNVLVPIPEATQENILQRKK